MLGFESFRTARRTLAGVEAMAMLAKGQVRAVPGNDMPAQRAFVASVGRAHDHCNGVEGPDPQSSQLGP